MGGDFRWIISELLNWAKQYWVFALVFVMILNGMRLQRMDLMQAKPVSFFHSGQLVVRRPEFYDKLLDTVILIIVGVGLPVIPFAFGALVPGYYLIRACVCSANEYVSEGELSLDKTGFQEIVCITTHTWGITLHHKKGGWKNKVLDGTYAYKNYEGIDELVEEAKRNGVPVYKDIEEEYVRKRINPFEDIE